MLFVVPVAEDDGELVVVGVGLPVGMDDEGSAQPVCVLARGVRVHPVCSPLARGIDGDLVRRFATGGDSTAKEDKDPISW